ncbi:thiolase C-terminal domain-containing protein [Ramlibacter sp.]|uniref:thiolase C-terminal domain-containing protein n=1 Tax=Ramlibacter sp. TaxID=1917967 RepID=UPI003D1233E4
MTSASIVGIGQTEFSTNSGRSELRLALEAILAAVADAGLSARDIDGFVRYTWDNNSEAMLTSSLGLPNVRYYGEVEHGGVNCCGAVAQAADAIVAGRASCVVVYRALNARSGTRYGRADRYFTSTGGDTVVSGREPPGDIYGAPFGLLVPTQFHAFYARRYAHEYGLSDEQLTELLGSIAVSQREYANRNPRALLHDRELTMEQYRASRMISEPLRMYDACLETDGAMAMVLVRTERGAAFAKPGVEVLAGNQHIRRHSLPMLLYNDDLHVCSPPEVAADLYGRAGVSAKDVDVAMIYDATTSLVPMGLEAFGLVEPGGSHAFFTSGQNRLDGRLPVNTHGGLLSEGYFHGLNTIAEAARQLRGDSHNQRKDARVALVTVRGASSLILGRA